MVPPQTIVILVFVVVENALCRVEHLIVVDPQATIDYVALAKHFVGENIEV